MPPFTFVRLQYRSGNWDTDPRMPSNLLHSLIQYTTVPVNEQEKVISLESAELFNYPFSYLSGHKLVQFNQKERQNFETYVKNGGFVFVDDCNHDIDGLFAKSFERQMATLFGASALKKLPNDHALYRSFFTFEDGPPATSYELNGWGDDLVHEYLKAVEKAGTDETEAVAKALHEMPVDDFFARNGKVLPNGRMIHDMYLYQVKSAKESTTPWDYYKLVATVPGEQAFTTPAESKCELLTKK